MFNLNFHQTDISKSCFLVTGGAGFIGSNIVEYLLHHKAGKVRVLDNLFNGHLKNIEMFTSNPAFEFILGNIENPGTCMEACEGMDIVFHQAALGSVPRSIKDPISSNSTNIGGFLNMLVAAKDNQIKRFVYASSSSVYGDSPKLPKEETDKGNPLSPYAVTKQVNELYAKVFASTYGIEIIGLRYFNVYGPKQDPKGDYAAVIPLFVNGILNNKTVTINGDGSQTRDFTFVADAVQANIRAGFTTNKSAVNEVYNVAAGNRISLNDLYNYLKKISGSSLPSEYGPDRHGDIKDSLANISKANTLLNYQPQFHVDKGLDIAFQWYKSNKDFIDRI